MSNEAAKSIRSPSYPAMSLGDAVAAIKKIEGQYRSSPVDRDVAAKLIGFSARSGPANKALADLAAYGLLERAGKGEARVTERARAILHADSDQERGDNLRAAAFEPNLFREIRERFPSLAIPPEDGVITYLNRRGFNPNAIRPAAKAFLHTMSYLEELRATESRGSGMPSGEVSRRSDGDPAADRFGGARIGDLVQWESQGALQFREPLRVRHVSDDGNWIAVEGSETGIPMTEVVVQEHTGDRGVAVPSSDPPRFELASPHQARPQPDEVEWMRNRVGRDTHVRLMVKGEMGPKEIKRLIRLLEAQRSVLMDDDADDQGPETGAD